MKKQHEERNLSMVMDFYEMTMANGYFASRDTDTLAVFDLFYRKNPDDAGFAIFAGLEQIMDYITNLHFEEEDIAYLRSQKLFSEDFLNYLKNYRFHGDIYSMPEGTVVYPNEPLITVVAPLLDAQLIETAMLLEVNHQSLIATKANRINRAAGGRLVSDFGARRAHNVDAAVYGARAAYIGGVAGTATVLAGEMFDIPISGTMAHSWVMFSENEYEAFKKYAETYPDLTVLLVDTYDVLKSGIPNAIRVAKEVLEPMGKRLKGVRLDSGDLAYLSKEARKMLDDAGLEDCKIIASNGLDEYTIRSLIHQGAKIDSFGVGERLITSASNPIFGAVYKLTAIEKNGKLIPKIKVSETIEKITNPGLKKIYRVYNEDGKAIADYLATFDEKIDASRPVRYIDPLKYWKDKSFENCTFKDLQIKVIENGKPIYTCPGVEEIQKYVRYQLHNEIWEEEQRFENPHTHYFDMSPAMFEMKMNLLYTLGKTSR
ncbi:MAG: nicotinate phosphoribosyltransferase [Oscillospiraceae bacterium]|nr:nicotinate phosphoribosyltransferase [Oscillospiraceae bacterium]